MAVTFTVDPPLLSIVRAGVLWFDAATVVPQQPSRFRLVCGDTAALRSLAEVRSRAGMSTRPCIHVVQVVQRPAGGYGIALRTAAMLGRSCC